MAVRSVAAEFDQISPGYDVTREAIAPGTLEAMAGAFRSRNVRRILEVGVGTGRVAAPLTSLGFEIVGVDASEGMMAKARAKGVERLVRGDALRLPLRDGAVDATLFVHVLHVVEAPARAIAEAIRVSRAGTFALVHPSDPGSEERAVEAPRRRARELLAAEGYSLGSRGGGPGRRERELLRACPPDEQIPLSDRRVRASLAGRLDPMLARAHRSTLRVPPEVLARVVAQVRREVGAAEVEYRQVEALARWWRAPAAANVPS